MYVLEFGKWNYRDLARKPEEKIQEFWKYFEQYARRVQRDAAVNNHQGTACITDYDGFRLAEYASSSGKNHNLFRYHESAVHEYSSAALCAHCNCHGINSQL